MVGVEDTRGNLCPELNWTARDQEKESKREREGDRKRDKVHPLK